MISTLENKMLTVSENKASRCTIFLDGDLGGCGMGDVGDPLTYQPELWEVLMKRYAIRSVLDVGCGFGYSTLWFEEAGCTVLGLEGSAKVADQAVCRHVRVHDFREGKPKIPHNFNLGWCSEVLEHIPQDCETNLFAAFARCRYVAVTAATPGQGGHHHVNEQTHEYWIKRFDEHGFCYLAEDTAELRAIRPDAFFAKNGLLFLRDHHVEVGPHWTEIGGWLPYEQGKFLQNIAAGNRVLDLGTYHGRSAICMAQTAKQVTTVDHHCGDDDTGRADSLAPFTQNLKRFGLEGKIEPIVGSIDQAYEEGLSERRFDLVFVDAGHGAVNVERDTGIAIECLQPGGTIIWHDYNYASVKAGVEATGLPMDSIQDLNAIGMLETARWQVMVAMPHSGNVLLPAAKAAMRGGLGRYADQVCFLDLACGCLPQNFNVLLSTALMNRDKGLITHLAMLHSDISADAGWVDLLAEEMCRKRCAAISAVVAIKDPQDDRTSTAIGSKSDPWLTSRYIRTRDEDKLPVTFGEDDVCDESGDEVLLINTGCMLLDLSYEFWDNFTFQVPTRKLRTWSEEKQAWQYECNFRPEDWEMSRALNAANLPYYATWRVKTLHHGHSTWENRPGLRMLANG